MSLFRERAVLSLTDTATGEAKLARPAGWRTYLSLAAAFLVLAVVLLVAIELPRTVQASGSLTPLEGLTWLHAPASGYVTEVHVDRGDTVYAGQPLFRIAADADDRSGEIGTLYRLIDAEAAALDSRIEAQGTMAVQRAREHRHRLHEAAAHLENLVHARALQEQQVALARRAWNATRLVSAQGAIAALESDRSRAVLLDQEQALQSLHTQIDAQRARGALLPDQEVREAAELKSERAALLQQRRELAQRRVQVELSRSTLVTATIAGRIADLQPRQGEQVAAQSRQVAITPHDERLQAELFIPSRALGLVRPGHEVRLHLEPLPHQKFGTLSATVREVSTVLSPEFQSSALPTLSTHVFRALADLHAQSVTLHGRAFPLQPDMRLHADVHLERRRAWEWLFEPLLDVLRR